MGWKTEAIISAMPGMLSLAAAGALDLGRAADITSDTMQAFGIASENATHVADVFAHAQANANTNVEQMGDAMTYLAPVANALGWQLEGAAAGIMAVSDAGVKGSMAGQAFATSLARLAKPTKAMTAEMNRLDMNLFANGQLKDLPDVIGEIEKATKGMTREQKSSTLTTMFGAQAYKHWAILLERGSDELSRMTGELENADGAAARMAETMMDNLGGQWELFKSGMAEAAYSIYELFEPALRDAVKVGIKFAAIIPSAAKAVAKFAKPFKPLGKAILIAVGAVASFFALVGTIKLIAFAFGLLATPIGLAIAAITGVVLAFQFAYKHIEPFRDIIDGVGRGLQGFWALLQGNEGKGVSLLRSTGMSKETYYQIKAFADGIIEAGKKLQQAKGAVVGFYDALTSGSGTADGLRSMLESGMSMDQIKRVYEFANEMRPAFDAVKQVFENFKTGLASGSVGGFMEAMGFSPEAIAQVTGTIDAVRNAFDSIKTSAVGLYEAVQPGIASVLESFIGFGETLTSVLTTVWSVISPIFDAIAIAFGIVADVAQMAFNNVIVPLVAVVVAAFQALWNIVGPILGFLGAAIEAAFAVLQVVWDNVIGPFIGFMTGLFADGMNTAISIIGGVGGAFDAIGSVITAVAGYVRDFASAISSVKIPDWVSSIGGKLKGAASAVSGFMGIGGRGGPKSNYHGIDYVPYDGYQTTLHKGERVQTAQEVREESKGGGGGIHIAKFADEIIIREEADMDLWVAKLIAAREAGGN